MTLSKNAALIVGAVTALIGLLVAFGIPITADQQGAIEDFVKAALALSPLIAALLIRPRVYSERSVEIVTGQDIDDVAQRLRAKQAQAKGRGPA